jgi:hypothetical protein
MSYTTQIGDTEFTHDGDYSGHVTIWTEGGAETINVPMADLMGFVAEIVRNRKTEKLATANVNEILGI